MPERPLRFGVICAGTRLPDWQARVISTLLEWDGAEIVLLLSSRDGYPGGSSWRAWFAAGVAPRAASLTLVDLADRLGGVPIASSGLDEGGALSHDALRMIREADLDVLLHLAPRALRGPALDLPRRGVWALEVGSGPASAPGLDELLDDRAATPVRLVRLRGSVVDVLHEGSFPSSETSYPDQLDRVLLGAAGFVVRAARELALGGIVAREGVPARPCEPTSRRHVLALAPRLAASAARRQARAFTHRAQWNVGIIDRPIASFLTNSDTSGARWIRPPETEGYIADPFGLRVGDRTWILAEHYRFEDTHGRIVALESRGGGPFQAPELVIDDTVHLSYPYLFEHDGETYCVPERGAAREVALYRAVELPHRWERLFTLLDDIAAADATVFEHEGLWWLFCTDADSVPAIDLHAFWAPDLRGPWRPHALNPLKTDVGSSRPGGTPFVVDDRLYRPAQDCSETYGGAVVVNEVLELSPTRFRERAASRLSPDPSGPYPEGVHTLSALGDVTLIDGKRWVMSSLWVRRQLRHKLGRLAGR